MPPKSRQLQASKLTEHRLWLQFRVNAALTKLRARVRRPERSLEALMPRFDADGWRIEPEAEGRPSAEMALENADTRALVRRMIDELPEGYRNLILLRDVECYSTEETASLLGLTPGAVKTGLHQARTALKSQMDSTLREEKSLTFGVDAKPASVRVESDAPP